MQGAVSGTSWHVRSFWHFFPWNPGRQEQLKLPSVLVQVPPFLQGLWLHSFRSISHFLPSNPVSEQSQWNLSLSTLQMPLLRHFPSIPVLKLNYTFIFASKRPCYIPFAGVAVLIHISEDSSAIIISSSGWKQFGPLKEANWQVTLPFRCLWISSLSLNCFRFAN